MKCTNPFRGLGLVEFACGQCQACRINKRREWTHRIMLEASQHVPNNAFVTLTLKELDADASVSPVVLSQWLKRLRFDVAPRKLRYFGVGEYGDRSGRPHYHVALFGLGCCTDFSGALRGRDGCGCYVCGTVRKTWGLGQILVGELTRESAQYIAGYVVKKMTRAGDLRLDGRHPEFARMSLKPGIGLGAMDDVASDLMMSRADARLLDAPPALRHGRSVLPLGRYLRRGLRARLGRDVAAPRETVEAANAANRLLDLPARRQAQQNALGRSLMKRRPL